MKNRQQGRCLKPLDIWAKVRIAMSLAVCKVGFNGRDGASGLESLETHGRL